MSEAKTPTVGDDVLMFEDGDPTNARISKVIKPTDDGMFQVELDEDHLPAVIYWSDDERMWVDSVSEDEILDEDDDE